MKKIMLIVTMLSFLSPTGLMAARFTDMFFLVDQSGSMKSELKRISSGPGQINTQIKLIDLNNVENDPMGFIRKSTDAKIGELMEYIPSNPVPEPATMLLMGSGLIGIGCFSRRYKKRA